MVRSFVLEDELHTAGDPGCGACLAEYPQPCRCGGLIHAAGGIEADGDVLSMPITRCDQCGRSMDDLAEETAG